LPTKLENHGSGSCAGENINLQVAITNRWPLTFKRKKLTSCYLEAFPECLKTVF